MAERILVINPNSSLSCTEGIAAAIAPFSAASAPRCSASAGRAAERSRASCAMRVITARRNWSSAVAAKKSQWPSQAERRAPITSGASATASSAPRVSQSAVSARA